MTTTNRPSLAQQPRPERIPLSHGQQRLWFLDQFQEESCEYNLISSIRLCGRLNLPALRCALSTIIQRHEVLRTRFVAVDGVPCQIIDSQSQLNITVEDYCHISRSDHEKLLMKIREEEWSKRFNLATGPLFRCRLLKLDDEQHILVRTVHHIIWDGWSRDVFYRELRVLYAAYLEGRSNPLPELAFQYADYAVWQRDWTQADLLRGQAEYWQKALTGIPMLLEVPTDRPRPPQRDYTAGLADLVLDNQLTARLRELSRRNGTTLYMTLLAAWAAVLSRLSGQQDVVIGTPVANRRRVAVEDLIGFFVNTLALRINLSGSPTVNELLARVKDQVLNAQAHQDIPFEQVVDLIQPVRSLASTPLFQVMFSWWRLLEEEAFELPGLQIPSVQPNPHSVARFDLSLSLWEKGGRISGGIDYSVALFERSTIERYVRYFRSLLEAMVADDTQVVDRLPMLGESERHRVLYEWNDTKTNFPSDKSVHQLFEEQVVKTPDAVAVIFEGAELSYAELNARANQLAHYLRELGVSPDVRVAICVERSLEMVVALMAVLKAGGAYVPLDPAYPVERLHFMLEDSQPIALLTQIHLEGLFSGLGDPLPILDLADSAAWKEMPKTNPDPHAIGLTPRHLAYVIYTSGSTGQPKGVMIEHRGVVNRLVWMQSEYELESCEAVLQKTPFGFDVSVWEFFWTLSTGAKLVVARPEGHKDPDYLIATIRRNNVTTIHFVPSMLQAFLESADLSEISTLVRVVCSGEPLSPALLRRFKHKLPNATLHNLYGPTETTVDVTAWTSPANLADTPVPIGRPVANTQIYILDAYGEPVPVGVSGELYIGGAGVARGYLNLPEMTAQNFLADPFSSDPNARMYRTGDLGRWRGDGNIEFLGRNDLQVKIRGFRIELGEIEVRLMEHPGVREAVVLAREDTPGDKRLVAYYTLTAEDGGPSAENLRIHLSANLPEHMVPAAYVLLERLPLTQNGKLDRRTLPLPEAGIQPNRNYEPPQGKMETKLTAIWAAVLKLERIGRCDDFFELGGNSLMIMRVCNRIRSELDIEVPLEVLYTLRTVEGIAKCIVEADSVD